jgi:GT2 family glycosyltransferase
MISVVIPHLDQLEELGRCIAALRAQRQPNQQVEIIVVDNGSKWTPAEIRSAFPDVTLLSERTPGPGPARNRGVAQATGEILAFIDADCIAHPDWLCEIERCFSERPDIGIIGGDVRIACQDPRRLTLLEAYESVFAYRMKEYIAKQGFTGTGNLAVRADILSAVGPFGGIEIAEDRDWGQRALRLGFRTHYCPGMIVYHPARKSLAEIARKWDRHVAHDFTRIQSKPGWRPRWILRSIAVALSPAAELIRIGSSDRLRGWRARLLAFCGVIVIRLYRCGVMLTLAFGADASRLSSQWNRV